MNDKTIEQKIQSKGLNAPRVTPADVEAEITHCYYINVGEAHRANWPDPDAKDEEHPSINLLTICVLVLRNGFTVTGESACASPENFDAEIGRLIARDKAVEKIWPLLGFRLRDQLSA
ncbi:Gp49 family protein [Stenotrophomonas rhizophila]